MNKRGITLIFGLLAVLVLSILSGSFFFKSITENNLVRRYVNSTQAFWVAEAGVAEAIKNLANSPTNGNLGNYRYETTTTYRATINASDYYDITSTGIVTLPGAGDIRRTVNVVVKRGSADATKFQYGIAAANDLCFGGPGACNKTPEDFLDPDICDGHPCWKEFDSTINFSDLFGYSQSDIENIATRYDDSNFPNAVSGITWVDVTEGSTLMVTGNLTGSGVLIIDGNVQFGGDYTFNGIVYILGTLTARGTFDSYGSILVASTAGVDTVNGSPTMHWDQAEIANGLQLLANNFVDIVSWKEGP
ncbi:MAG: hypothetical protein Q8R31_06835 [Candidatus Omnitrophota bacterium]|nr:hypothetical protein [Candidatus Omnitrophota bacterium]